MRNIVLPAVAAAALACAASPAQAQVVIRSGYSQPYYGGYSQPYYGGYSQPYYGGYSQPYYGGATIGNGGLIQAAEGYLLNQTGLGSYAVPYTSGYGNFSSFGSQPYYGGGYSSFSPYYGGSSYRSYGGNGWGYGRRR
jgi:hypothetical protein